MAVGEVDERFDVQVMEKRMAGISSLLGHRKKKENSMGFCSI